MTIAIALIAGVWVVIIGLRSFRKIRGYIDILKQDKDALNAINSSTLSHFREFRRFLVSVPSRDGSGRMVALRTVDASEVFRTSDFAASFSSNRLFLAIPTILTGIGVLGTFVGLQMGIGALDLKNLKELEKSIIPLIQGCAVAFSTSVWGVTTSLMFSGLEKALETAAIGRIHRFQKRLDALVSGLTELQAKWFKGVEVGFKALNDQIGQIIKTFTDSVEGQTRNLMNQWTKEVSECLQTYEKQVESIQDGIEDLQAVVSLSKRNR